MQLPNQDNTVGKALKTFVQSMFGLLIGLIWTVWNVQGVPHAVIVYAQQNLPQLLLTFGIPTALSSFVWNLFRPSQKVY